MTIHDFSGRYSANPSAGYSSLKWQGAEELDTTSQNRATSFMVGLLQKLFGSLIDE